MRPKMRRGGVVKGCLVVCGLCFLGLCLMAMLVPKVPRPDAAVSTPPSVTPTPPVLPAGPLPEGLAVGDRVEVSSLLVCVDPDVLPKTAAEPRPAGLVNGKDVFGVFVGSPADVTALRPGAVRVHMVGGNWPGRTGWVRPDEVQKPPTDEESAADVIRGLTQLRRREIYRANGRAGLEATAVAEEQVPLSGGPTGPGSVRQQMARNQAVYARLKAESQRALMKAYRIDRAQLEAIDKEGAERKWPYGGE